MGFLWGYRPRSHMHCGAVRSAPMAGLQSGGSVKVTMPLPVIACPKLTLDARCQSASTIHSAPYSLMPKPAQYFYALMPVCPPLNYNK